MILLLLKLVFYHLTADFLLQNNWMIRGKMRGSFFNPGALAHIAVHAVLLMIIIWLEGWSRPLIGGAAIILSSHYLIDWVKLRLENDNNRRLLFFLDQLSHIIILAAVAWYVSGTPSMAVAPAVFHQLLLLATALLLVTKVAGIVTSVLLSKWTEPGTEINNSLTNAGMHIGYLERFLIFIFIINAQWAAVGLLLTAKSIFRFSEIEKNRKLAEYFLMGTLISLTLATIISLAYSTLKAVVAAL